MLFRSLKPLVSTLSLPVARPPRSIWPRRIVKGLLLSVCIAFGIEAARVLFGGNIHEVVPGSVYRSAQLSPDELRELLEKQGIRTVVNLRGYCSPFEWYLDECRTTHAMNVCQEDITLSAIRLPPPMELRRLIEVLDRAEHPVLLHCRQGADRTGLASAIAMLLQPGSDLGVARGQCSIRYAHFDVLGTANMDRFFDIYEGWLKQTGQRHTPERFRSWAAHEYRPDPAPARIELLSKIEPIRLDAPLAFTVRCHNLSNGIWEFKRGTVAGVHVRTVVEGPDANVAGIYRAGRFEARVAPGESIDIPIALPPFHREGSYRVIIDVVDRNLSFCQLGSELLELEVRVVKTVN
jgi:protein tyrosine phosphatase (PTP) superfamily phosphohydrolase (DUF442 family)